MRIIIAILFAGTVVVSQVQAAKNEIATVESENRIGVYGGMGIHVLSAQSIVDYLNALPTSSTRIDNWGTAVEFFGGVEIPVSPLWAVKVEHSFLFKSYTIDAGTYNEDLHYDVQAPMVMVQYVIPGKGYFVKFSGGGGYHWGTVTPPKLYGVTTNYRATGPGMRAEAEGQTAFDAHLFGYISASLGAELLGKVKSADGQELWNGGGTVSLNYFNVGVRFGLMYYF